MARPPYNFISHSLDVIPRQGCNLEQGHSLQLRSTLKERTAEGCQPAALPTIGAISPALKGDPGDVS